MLSKLPLNSLSDDKDFNSTSIAGILKQCPLGFVDIGARGGAHDVVFDIARYTSVLAFEPDQTEYDRLMLTEAVSKPWASFNLKALALGAASETANLHLLTEPNNNSLLAPNSILVERYNMAKWMEVGLVPIKTVTLDSVIFDSTVSGANFGEFIKLDTQGTEFDILLGASRTLSERCVAIVTEVSFCQLYKNQKLFSDVEQLLRRYGFAFYGFRSMHTRSCKLLDKRTHSTSERSIYADAVFLKDPLQGSEFVDFNERQQKILFLTATLLQYYDFALELPKKTWLRGKNGDEYEHIQGLIMNRARLPLESTLSSLDQLSKEVHESPELANVLVGAFVDRRRMLNNYDDVLNVSPLPRSLKADES